MAFGKDPRWILAKYKSVCHKCRKTVKARAQAFYFPVSKEIYCPDCGGVKYRELVAAGVPCCGFNDN